MALNQKSDPLDSLIKHHANLFSEETDLLIKLMRLATRIDLYRARGMVPEDQWLEFMEEGLEDLESYREEREVLQIQIAELEKDRPDPDKPHRDQAQMTLLDAK